MYIFGKVNFYSYLCIVQVEYLCLDEIPFYRNAVIQADEKRVIIEEIILLSSTSVIDKSFDT